VIVLGIDPGTAALGYGIVDSTAGRVREVDHGCLTTSPDESLPDRLLAIHTLVDELIEIHRPGILAVERLFFSRNVQTAFAVGQARGVVLLAAAQHGVPVREATPNEVKSAIAGYGAADKEQVQRMVQMVLGMPERPRPDDAADALAIAIWAANTAGSAGARLSPVMDRSSIDPIARGESSYQRAVREALSRERAKAANGTGGLIESVAVIESVAGAGGADVVESATSDEPVEAPPARPAKGSASR
jgi:crossover junction endodeoxyribonuclease RuvC